MAAASAQQDFLCRVFGRCRHGAPIDLEIGDMLDPQGKGPMGQAKLFSYVRYNVDLTQRGLDGLGLAHIRAADVQKMDSVGHIPELAEVGVTAAMRDVSPAHFQGFLA
jgi:hypothetical protein